jgi:L-ascorbate metabolism protein UlaG (beta-lactamase superfamily)
MIINYLGLETFKLQVGDLTLAINPPSKEGTHKVSKFGSDIVLSSLLHENMNGGEEFSFGEKVPFVIQGPGEYEVKGVFIQGLPGVSEYDGENRINTIYTIVLDNMRVCYLGAQSSKTLTAATKEAINEVDVLIVPVGGEGVLDPAAAYQLAVSLEPKIIIPMHYDKKSLETFLKEGSQHAADMVEKLTIKRKDIEGKQGEIIVVKQS